MLALSTVTTGVAAIYPRKTGTTIEGTGRRACHERLIELEKRDTNSGGG